MTTDHVHDFATPDRCCAACGSTAENIERFARGDVSADVPINRHGGTDWLAVLNGVRWADVMSGPVRFEVDEATLDTLRRAWSTVTPAGFGGQMGALTDVPVVVCADVPFGRVRVVEADGSIRLIPEDSEIGAIRLTPEGS